MFVDVLSATDTKLGAGPVANITRWSHTRRLDRAGTISFDAPATDERTSLLQLRRYVRCWDRRLESFADFGHGIIDTIGIDTDERLLSVGGDDLLRELAMRSVADAALKNAGETPMSLADALDEILDKCNNNSPSLEDWTVDKTTYASTGSTTNANNTITAVTNIANWTGREGSPIFGSGIPAGATVVAVDVGAAEIEISANATATAAGVSISRSQVYHTFNGESVLQAFIKLGELTGTHFRLGTGREIEWLFNVQPASGIRAVIGVDPIAAEANPDICLITGLEYIQDSYETISRLHPYGAGSGSARIDLNGTTRTAPDGYTLDETFNFLERDDAETDYGFDVIYRTFNDISPAVEEGHADYAAALVAAKDTLFDATLEYLRTHSYPQESYRLTVTKLDEEVLPGETIRVIYRGWVDGYKWIDKDEDLLILEATTEISDAGVRTPSLIVSTLDRWPTNDVELLVKMLRDVGQAQAHLQSAVADGSVTTAKVVDGAITPAKVSQIAYPLAKDVTTATVTNTTTETTVFSTTIPGGTLGTSNALRLALRGTYFNNTGAGATVRVKVTYGATLIYDDVSAAFASSASGRSYRVDLDLAANNATNAQIAHGLTIVSAAGGLLGVTTSTSGIRDAVHSSIAEDSTADKTLAVTITLGAASANLTVTVNTVRVELLKG